MKSKDKPLPMLEQLELWVQETVVTWRFAHLKLQMVLGFEEDLVTCPKTKFHQSLDCIMIFVCANSLFGISHLVHQIRWHDTVFTSLGSGEPEDERDGTLKGSAKRWIVSSAQFQRQLLMIPLTFTGK